MNRIGLVSREKGGMQQKEQKVFLQTFFFIPMTSITSIMAEHSNIHHSGRSKHHLSSNSLDTSVIHIAKLPRREQADQEQDDQEIESRTCSRCYMNKDLSAFAPMRDGSSLQKMCRQCRQVYIFHCSLNIN